MDILPYNVSERKLLLPEYGRNIQKMIDHCLTIEDRNERTACATGIAEVMATLFPEVVGENGDCRKIWDHINIMSEFKLDVDFPCEVLKPEEIKPKADKMPYAKPFVRYRHYGRNLQDMINVVADMENCIEKDQMIFLLANQMKKILLLSNPESASDARVFDDIADISKGRIAIDSSNYRLNEYVDVSPTPSKGKKKNKNV